MTDDNRTINWTVTYVRSAKSGTLCLSLLCQAAL